jgi:hypothetical protein
MTPYLLGCGSSFYRSRQRRNHLGTVDREIYADIRPRVYRGTIDTPKTDQSVRHSALPEGLLREIEVWREFSVETRADAWVFPSEPMTPLCPKLSKVSLGCANFLLMVADQLGHSLDVSQNVYTQSPVESRLAGLNRWKKTLSVNQTEHWAKPEFVCL